MVSVKMKKKHKIILKQNHIQHTQYTTVITPTYNSTSCTGLEIVKIVN